MNVFMHAQVRRNLRDKLQLLRYLIDQNVASIHALKARLPRLRHRKEAKIAEDEARAVRLRDRAVEVDGVAHHAAIAAEQTHRTDSLARVVAADTEINRVKGEVNALGAKIASLISVEILLAKMLSEESNKEDRINIYIATLESHAANQDLPQQINLRETVDLIRNKKQELLAVSQTKWARFAREGRSQATLLAVSAFTMTILASGEISVRSMMMAIIVMASVYGLVNGVKARVDNPENQLESMTQSIESIATKAAEFIDKFINLVELTSETPLSELAAMRRVAEDSIAIVDRRIVATGIFAEEPRRTFGARAQDIETDLRHHIGSQGVCTIL